MRELEAKLARLDSENRSMKAYFSHRLLRVWEAVSLHHENTTSTVKTLVAIAQEDNDRHRRMKELTEGMALFIGLPPPGRSQDAEEVVQEMLGPRPVPVDEDGDDADVESSPRPPAMTPPPPTPSAPEVVTDSPTAAPPLATIEEEQTPAPSDVPATGPATPLPTLPALPALPALAVNAESNIADTTLPRRPQLFVAGLPPPWPPGDELPALPTLPDLLTHKRKRSRSAAPANREPAGKKAKTG